VANRRFRSVTAVIVVSLFVAFFIFIFSFPARRNDLDFSQFYSAAQLSGKDSAQNYITSGCNCNSSQKLPGVHVFYNHQLF